MIGPNGAGKSSLFNLISGAIRPSAGQVLFEGRDMTGQRPDKMLAAGLARSFQITNLFFELPVRENLRLAAQFVENGRGLFRGIAASRVAAVALAARPRLLLLDEPTQGMSHADTQDTEALIRSLAAEGLSLLLVEHDVELVMNLSDHVVVMHQGAKLAEGPPLQVRADPAVQAAYFGDAREASHA